MANKPKKKKRKSRRLPPIPMIEEPGKRYYLQRLNWLLGFLNADIAAMPTGDFLKLFHEFLVFFYQDAVKDESEFRKWCVDTDIDRSQMLLAQVISVNLVQRLKSRNAREELPVSLNVQYVAHVDNEDKVILKRDQGIGPYPEVQEGLEYSDRASARDDLPSREAQGQFSNFGVPRFDDTVRYGVLTLLTKFPLSSIQHCPRCEKFYKSSRRKESPFCRTCLTRKGVNEWRDKNREIYNRYQASLREGRKITIEEIRAELKQEKKTKEVNNGT